MHIYTILDDLSKMRFLIMPGKIQIIWMCLKLTSEHSVFLTNQQMVIPKTVCLQLLERSVVLHTDGLIK